MSVDDSMLRAIEEWRERRLAGTDPTPEELRPVWPPAKWNELRSRIEVLKRTDEPLDRTPDHVRKPMAPSRELLRGGQYQCIRVIGRGGMGAVFKARDNRNRLVAIKVLRDASVLDPVHVVRFKQEMLNLAGLEHPEIVCVRDWGEVNGRPYFVMEYLEGVNLFRLVERIQQAQGVLPVTDACEITRRVALGLHYVHGKNLVHRDVKPGNIILTVYGVVKLLDLGLGKSLKDEVAGDQLTKTGIRVGSVPYMAPEQLTDPDAVNHRADIYALGRTLCYLLTGNPSWKPAPSLLALREDVPAGLEDVLSKMIKTVPTDRYPSAAAVAEAISPFCSSADLTRHREAVKQAMQAAELEPTPEEVAFLRQLGAAPDASGPKSGNKSQEAFRINVPGPPTEFFTGRAKEIALCHDLLNSHQRVAFVGPSGIGKTETALAYADRYQADYKVVIWANASSSDGLARLFAEIAGSLKLRLGKRKKQPHVPSFPQVGRKPKEFQQAPEVAAVKRWLARNDHWLLVLDDADDLATPQPFLPDKHNGHVMFTTQARWTRGLAEPIGIFPLEPEEGALLVLRRAGRIRPDQELEDATTAERTAALDISKEMKGVPLALELAGAFIAQMKPELSLYLSTYREGQADVRVRRIGHREIHRLLDEQGQIERPRDSRRGTVVRTWWLNYQEVTRANRAAYDLLRLWGWMEFDELPDNVLPAAGRLATGVDGQPLYEPSAFDTAIEAVSSFSLLRRHPYTKTISMHPLLRKVGWCPEDSECNWTDSEVIRLACDALAVIEAFLCTVENRETEKYPLYVLRRLAEFLPQQWPTGIRVDLLRRICSTIYHNFGKKTLCYIPGDDFEYDLAEWLHGLPRSDPLWDEIPDYLIYLETLYDTAPAREPSEKTAARDGPLLRGHQANREQPGRLWRVGLDESCPCGSGKKFQDCCRYKPSPDDTKRM